MLWGQCALGRLASRKEILALKCGLCHTVQTQTAVSVLKTNPVKESATVQEEQEKEVGNSREVRN